MNHAEFVKFFSEALEMEGVVDIHERLDSIKSYDSTGVLMLSCAIEDTFHCEVDFLAMRACATVHDMYVMVMASAKK